MPATPHYPTVPKPHAIALNELERIGLEAARILARGADVLVFTRSKPERIEEGDLPLLREARRDLEHGRLILEGLIRRHGIPSSETKR